MELSLTCPFCGSDPYDYVNNGVCMEPVAITCCELGIEWFKRHDELPDTVTISWEDFAQFAKVYEALRTLGMNP